MREAGGLCGARGSGAEDCCCQDGLYMQCEGGTVLDKPDNAAYFEDPTYLHIVGGLKTKDQS